MAVITISREYGSDGDWIAERVAQSLGYHLVGKELIGALLSEYGLVEFDKEYERLPSFWERFNAQREQRREQIVLMLNQIVPALAQHGNTVIVGRSGFAILRGYADVLNVLEADKGRTAFIESFYKVRWNDATAFDLVINTGKVSAKIAVPWVVQATQALHSPSSDAGPTCASIAVDPILAKTVSDMLSCVISHRPE